MHAGKPICGFQDLILAQLLPTAVRYDGQTFPALELSESKHKPDTCVQNNI